MKERYGLGFNCEVTLRRKGVIIDKRFDPPKEDIVAVCKELVTELNKLIELMQIERGEN